MLLWVNCGCSMQMKCSLIEGNLLYTNGEKVTIEFQPSADQAWQFWANNELTQSATYPSMFAKVHKSELSYIGGSIGTDTTDKWAIPNKESREIDLALLEIKRNELAEKNLSPQNFHRKELEFNGRERTFDSLVHLELGCLLTVNGLIPFISKSTIGVIS